MGLGEWASEREQGQGDAAGDAVASGLLYGPHPRIPSVEH